MPQTLSQKRHLLKAFLDAKVHSFKTPAYIGQDPLQFPYRYQKDPRACEFVAFFAALFSYGRREKIIETVDWILGRMDHDPAGFLSDFHPQKDKTLFQGFVYRFNTSQDLLDLFTRLQAIYAQFGSLEHCFMNVSDPNLPLKERIAAFLDTLLDNHPMDRYGLKFLFAHPAKGGACKRFNMFLRWMVRADNVDLGLWQTALTPADLLIPLDTHVIRMAKLLKLTERNPNDWQTAEEITEVFREFCPEDPVKYDFALFALGLEGWRGSLKDIHSLSVGGSV